MSKKKRKKQPAKNPPTPEVDDQQTIFIGSMVGRSFDDFKVLKEIGVGGMGVVYKAKQLSLDRNIALKVLREEYSKDESFTERFRREAHAAAKLNHPNIVQIYTIGEVEGMYYYTMEFIIGDELSDLMRRERPLRIDRTVEVVGEICKALDYAHRNKVVHRDIKPNNIIVNDEGITKILDFGIAKALDTSTMTATGLIVGTPQYMSPEQAEGKEIDGRSDIYALGIMFYEMITGKLPFKGDTPIQTLYKHVHEHPKPPRDFNRNIPESVQSVVLRAIEKDPERRYDTGKEMLEELQTVMSPAAESGDRVDQDGATVFVGSRTDSVPVRKIPKKKLALIGSVLVAIILVGASFLYQQFGSSGPQDNGPKVPPGSVENAKLTVSSIPAGAAIRVFQLRTKLCLNRVITWWS